MAYLQKWGRWLLLIALAFLLIQFHPVREHFLPSHDTPFLDELVPKFGDALLIAWFIALMVDIGAKKELISDLLFDSSAHIIGRQLPEDIREEVREYLNVPFIRHSWKITYRITDYPKQSAVELRSSYLGDLENLTTKRRKFTLRVALDPGWMQGLPQPKLVRVEFRRNQINVLKSQLAGLEFRELVTVKPGVTGRCESLHECVEYFPDSYEYAMINEATVQSTELTIHWDKAQFEVEVNLSAGSDGKVRSTHFETYSIWVINKPLLPGQCILTRWKRKPEPTLFSVVEKPLIGIDSY